MLPPESQQKLAEIQNLADLSGEKFQVEGNGLDDSPPQAPVNTQMSDGEDNEEIPEDALKSGEKVELNEQEIQQ